MNGESRAIGAVQFAHRADMIDKMILVALLLAFTLHSSLEKVSTNLNKIYSRIDCLSNLYVKAGHHVEKM